MRRPGKLTIVIALAVAGLLVGVIALALWVRSAKDEFFHPAPPAVMPVVVPGTTEELLATLDAVLRDKAPAVAAALQPGLNDGEIDALEAKGGFKLTDELRALYRWHNGMTATLPGGWPAEFTPIHRFMPLDETVAERQAYLQQLKTLPAPQRALESAVAGHRHDWLMVFGDPAGDGYLYDPGRRQQPGHFFYCFAEDNSYEYFPSLRNFLAGVIECYEAGVYRPAAGGKGLDQDFEKAEKVWAKYRATNYETP